MTEIKVNRHTKISLYTTFIIIDPELYTLPTQKQWNEFLDTFCGAHPNWMRKYMNAYTPAKVFSSIEEAQKEYKYYTIQGGKVYGLYHEACGDDED